jgi:S-adenosylmethionine synthetase
VVSPRLSPPPLLVLDLTLNHPVKELVWVFQDARKVDCSSDSSIALGYTPPIQLR